MASQTTTIRKPNTLEKRRQLERLIASALFKRHPKLAELLNFLAESEIAGVAVDERLAGVKVYGRSEDWITVDDSCARDGLSRLRKQIESYYAVDGVEDRLNLELNRYTATFSYNLRHPVEHHLNLAARYIGNDPRAAFRHLDAALSIEPDNTEALAGRLETELWRIFYGYDMDLPAFYESIEFRLQEILRSDSECWRAHIVNGAMLCWRQRWNEAEIAFSSALLISERRSHAHPWYAGFLMATGQTSVALDLMKAKASEPSDSPWPQLTYTMFLYAGRNNAEAEDVLRRAIVEEPHRRLFRVMRYLTIFAREGFPSKYDRVHVGAMAEIRPETDDLWYPIFSFYCHLIALDPDYFSYKLVSEGIKYLAKRKLTRWRRPPAGQKTGYAGPYLSPFQLAIGHMAIGETGRAIELLENDLMAGHPLLAWLHLWPVFDPLRGNPSFDALVDRMKLPTRILDS